MPKILSCAYSALTDVISDITQIFHYSIVTCLPEALPTCSIRFRIGSSVLHSFLNLYIRYTVDPKRFYHI